MKVGLISDNHGHLKNSVFDLFSDVHVILHAGDMVNPNTITELEAIAPVRAIHGNSDSYPLVSQLPAIDWISLDGKLIVLTHIIGRPKDFLFKLFRNHRSPMPDIVVFGHTHIRFAGMVNSTLFVNPGCAGESRCTSPSIAILDLEKSGTDSVTFLPI